MSPPKATVPKAAQPVYGQAFDPWNSSSTGHQRAENRLGASTGWRESRNRKLTSQFAGGAGGGKRVSDSVGEGSKDWDKRIGGVVTPEMRARAARGGSVLDMLARPGSMKKSASLSASAVAAVAPATTASALAPDLVAERGRDEGNVSPGEETTAADDRLMAQQHRDKDAVAKEQAKQPPRRRIFDGVVVYVNGSTHPLISDHKLKHVLAEHGGSMSSHLGRRKVTHVILGRPAAGAYGGGGGGLAGGKIQREISKLAGSAVKYVGVEWVLESIKAGKRLPETRFADLKVAAKRQQSVYGLCSRREEDKNMKTPAAAASIVDETQPPPSGQACSR
ncbi:BRCA1 C terminus domain-containing protein [Nemania sp. FL0916]|nr:BRCA1 C terminus domain-containing protein [Nemania sp. FL0916]